MQFLIDKHRLLESVILFPLAAIWILRTKIGKNGEKPSVLCVIFAVCMAVILGAGFFEAWSKASQVKAIAAVLHLSAASLTLIAAFGLAVCAIWSLSVLFSYVKECYHAGSRRRVVLYCFVGAFLCVALSQIMGQASILSMGLFRFLWGMLTVMVVVFLLCCLTGRVKLSVILGTGLFMLLSTVNSYVYRFRGRLFDPLDIFSFTTAMNVSDNYSLLPIPWGVAASWVIWLGALILLLKVGTKKEHLSGKHRIRMGVCCLIGALMVTCYTLPLKTYYWDREGVQYCGYILNFVSKIKHLYVSKPDGYSTEEIQAMSEQYADQTDPSVTDAATPHIIVIMDEAFSDLRVFGELSTNMEPMPFVSALKESTVSGYALASVYGGNTANSEYEFLTGNSMAWLSPNAVPYQQYITKPTYSMASYLKKTYQYQCVAMHPYLSTGWNRPNAYRYLGFDESLFLEAFPQQDYIREYISDREMFETLIKVYESHRQAPLFLFGVSMQNHGGYSYVGDHYTQTISATGLSTEYSRVDQYLSLIYETDKAVEYLINYFSSVDEDVVILFFGDHQPKLDAEFYLEFPQSGTGSLDEQQRKYMIPFFIWANYPIETEQVACTSLNYLSSYLYRVAGIPMPAYNQFLSEMESAIPAINANGFYSPEAQCYLPFEEASAEERIWLQKYQQLQYNNLFDKAHRNENLFP